VRLHRALTLGVMILLSLALIALMTAYGVATFSGASLLALVVVLAAAVAGGVAFSYRRYFPRRP
jgi:uncharacterized membrane-anchored protein